MKALLFLLILVGVGLGVRIVLQSPSAPGVQPAAVSEATAQVVPEAAPVAPEPTSAVTITHPTGTVVGDPPGYARALIGRVVKVLPEGVVVEGVSMNQIHMLPTSSVDHWCFAGVGGRSFVQGIKDPCKVGDKIEIMVTRSIDTALVTFDSTHQENLEVINLLSKYLDFPLQVDWDP